MSEEMKGDQGFCAYRWPAGRGAAAGGSPCADQPRSRQVGFAAVCVSLRRMPQGGPHGLAKGKSAASLAEFLREHYTTSGEQAASLAAYVAGRARHRCVACARQEAGRSRRDDGGRSKAGQAARQARGGGRQAQGRSADPDEADCPVRAQRAGKADDRETAVRSRLLRNRDRNPLRLRTGQRRLPPNRRRHGRRRRALKQPQRRQSRRHPLPPRRNRLRPRRAANRCRATTSPTETVRPLFSCRRLLELLPHPRLHGRAPIPRLRARRRLPRPAPLPLPASALRAAAKRPRRARCARPRRGCGRR